MCLQYNNILFNVWSNGRIYRMQICLLTLVSPLVAHTRSGSLGSSSSLPSLGLLGWGILIVSRQACEMILSTGKKYGGPSLFGSRYFPCSQNSTSSSGAGCRHRGEQFRRRRLRCLRRRHRPHSRLPGEVGHCLQFQEGAVGRSSPGKGTQGVHGDQGYRDRGRERLAEQPQDPHSRERVRGTDMLMDWSGDPASEEETQVGRQAGKSWEMSAVPWYSVSEKPQALDAEIDT